jgi:carbamoyltransferase
MRILGLTSFKHDTSAALLEDGVVRAAIENDKLVRHPTRGVPDNAIQFCLDDAKITLNELDAIVLATDPIRGWLRRSVAQAAFSRIAPLAAARCQADEIGRLAREIGELRTLKQLKQRAAAGAKVTTVDHHTCHAASAFFQSPFERALIVTLDNEGDGLSGTVSVGQGTKLRVLKRIPFTDSLARIYSEVTRLVGFRAHKDEHKTQWFSLEGEPTFKDVFLEMMRKPGDPLPCLNHSFFEPRAGQLVFSNKFYEAIKNPATGQLVGDHSRALASSIQQACSEIVTDLIAHFLKSENLNQVCLAGGFFQNLLVVAHLEDKFRSGNVFVPPAPGNAGTAVGAGLLFWHHRQQKPRAQRMPSVFLGPKFKPQEIKDVLDNSKARYSLQNTETRKLDAAVELLKAGKIVGWYQGAAEFGPRALGNRSVLASPWAAFIKENLNDYIKHREWFRPFALAVPEEDCDVYFEASSLCRVMNSLGRARTDCDPTVRGFSLPDGRIRLHLVERNSNPLFWRLLKRFGECSPAPILLNTSFNLFGEPLVVTPRDAIRSYFCSGIDALVIDNFALSKHGAAQVVAGTRAPAISEPAVFGRSE